jgi:hypothetical protein
VPRLRPRRDGPAPARRYARRAGARIIDKRALARDRTYYILVIIVDASRRLCRHAPRLHFAERIYRRAPATTRTVYRTPRRLGSAVANASSYGDCVAADHMSLRVVNEASANGMDQEFCHRPFRLVGTYIVALEYTHMRASHSPMHWSPVLA